MNDSVLGRFLHNKWIWLILAIDAIIIIVMIVLSINKATRTAMLVLDVAPYDATISLNGDKNYSNGTYELTPGDYKVEISHDGLDTKTFDVTIQNGEIANITTYLTSDGNIDWYKQKDNKGSFDKLQQMASSGNNQTTDQDELAAKQIRILNDNFQKLQNLPINKVEYNQTDSGRKLALDITIRAKYDDECSTWLCVEALMYGTDDQEYIKQLLTNNGFDAEEYEIHYKTY